MTGSCSNSRSITCAALEARILEGLRARLMAPEVAAEAMRAYAEETNRLNRERRAGGEADRKALADVERKLKEIVTVIEDGGYSGPLMTRLRELETKQDDLMCGPVRWGPPRWSEATCTPARGSGRESETGGSAGS